MKKSKIIVPALAVLVLSTASAVSGTVAWFTAARSATIESTSTVINPEGTLNVQLEQLVATSVSGTTVTMGTNNVLRDASVATTGSAFTAYRAILGSTSAPTGYAAVTDANTYDVKKGSDTYHVYYYATFRASFSVNGASATSKYDIFFDAASSTAATTDTVQNGYRVAMMSAGKSTPCVWAPKSAATTVSYVNGTAADALGSYTKVAGTVGNSATKATAQADAKFLGTINGTTPLAVDFVVWYDGTDTSVVTSNLGFLEMSTATYTMSFNAIDQADYAAA